MRLKKIQAGALQFTIFIMVVIALLLAAFIILIHTHKTFKMHASFLIETVANTDKGIHYTLENKLLLRDSTVVNLQDEDYKTLKIHRDYWGIYEKVIAVSNIKNKTFKKVALVGGLQPNTNRVALYLKEQNKPLVLVGNTKIQGCAYLPKQGVRTGNISGHSYYGNQLIYGEIKAIKTLPKLQSELLYEIDTIRETYKTIGVNQFLDLNAKKTYENSFYNPIQILYSDKPIELSEVSLTGHIIVQSEIKISVDASSKLKDVVLLAPSIEIKNNVEGVFQAFATKGIAVGRSCILHYPSALVVKEKAHVITQQISNKETSFVKIDKGSKISGIITYLGSTKNYKDQVFIDEKTIIAGEVYCNRNTELLGSVYGSVFTAGFVAKQSGSVYQNHIYNGEIMVNNLAQEYVGLVFDHTKKGIAKWLY